MRSRISPTSPAAYLKDTSGDAVALTELLTAHGDRIHAFNGWDTLTFYGLAAGARASVWGAAGIVPDLAVQLWDTLAVKADLVAARAQWKHLWAISDFLESVDYVAGIKTGLEIVGHPPRPRAATGPTPPRARARAVHPHPRRLVIRPGPLTLTTVEVHAEGEPGRVILDAGHLVRGDTMTERLAYCRANLDWLRELMLHEPRGHPALCAVLILPPVTRGADFGIIVLEQGGFTPMSGSNTMCAVVGAVAAGLLTPTGSVLHVTIDTAVGTVTARADIRDGKVVAVTVANVPAYVVALDTLLDVPGLGIVPVDVVFGGQFFVQAAATDCGVDLHPARARDLVRAGALLCVAARQQLDVRHPLNPDIAGVSLVMLHSGAHRPGKRARNTVVLTRDPLDPDRPETLTGVLDRSPCGTGTCARMAALHAHGQLAIGEQFTHYGIIDSSFTGWLTATTDVAGIPAVRPVITGRAWITGRASWSLDTDEPYHRGYTVPDIWPPRPAFL